MTPQATLTPLDDERPPDAAACESFRRRGHALVRGLASAAEIAAWRPAILSVCERMKYETRPLEERDTYGKAFLQYWGLSDEDATVRRFSLARRFARVAADLMGVDEVRLYHDQALLKEPGGGPTPFHQDQYYWPIDTLDTVTMWMPLVDVPREVGSMTFVDGSHREGMLGKFEISDESERFFGRMIKERGLATHSYGAMSAGDATFHAGWTMHGAPPNPSRSLREVMTIIYVSADARMTVPDEHQSDEAAMWLRGLAPGDVVSGPLHPVTWSCSPSPSG